MNESRHPPNRLSRESSPYLLLHARNPVDWYAWGDEAFERARREDKPIFLSVGYSTCYWCHVMERESFSDEAIASQLNQDFVSIKLDREERPDLDEIYMTATHLLTHSGGWPNSLFLTHDLEPFFAGTYFPPDDRRGRAGFPRVLAAVLEAWRERRDGVREQAAAVAEAIRRQMADSAATARLPPLDVVSATQTVLARRFDREWGGFGDAPKFPSPSSLFFLLDRARQGDDEARDMLVVTLDRMARGGLQDQLAGGFHRYSTDAFWLVPHFEKMLYDNASLALLYAEVARSLPEWRDAGATRGEFERVARATCDFVLAELTGEHGAFLSAIDAETDGHEGAFYTWTAEELRAALDADAWKLLAGVYGFDGRPNFEDDRYVLHLPQPLDAPARRLGLDGEALRARLDAGRRALLAARARRPRPLTDDKVLCDWNGLMIAALARAGRLLDEPRYIAAARRAAEFVLARLRDASGELLHTWREGQARVAAMLDDYAFVIDGLLALHAAEGDARWLDAALRLQAEQDRRLHDEAGGGWFSSAAHPHLLVRARSAHDGALPAGNGVAACNLLELHARTGDPAWRARAERAVCAFGNALEQFPLAHVTLVRALDRLGRGALARDDGRAVFAAPTAASLETQARDVVAVEATYDPRVPGPWKPLRVDLIVRAGWHVNANPASHPFLVPTRVAGAGLRDVRYPAGRELHSDVAPEALVAYDTRVTIEAEIEADGGSVAPLEVTFQPCDASRCLPAVTLRVTPRPAGA